MHSLPLTVEFTCICFRFQILCFLNPLISFSFLSLLLLLLFFLIFRFKLLYTQRCSNLQDTNQVQTILKLDCYHYLGHYICKDY